jgi:hypothetical protein
MTIENQPQTVLTDEQDRIGIDFIDPLFAVAFDINFAELLHQGWFKNFHLLELPENAFVLGTLVLCYVVVIWSWVGYHKSIAKLAISLRRRAGAGRFVLDVVLLLLYFVLLASFENFRRELWILVVIFSFFVFWDQFKRAETKQAGKTETVESIQRRGVTVFWLLIFTALALFYHLHPPQVRYECEDWIILIAAIFGNIMYRFHKDTHSFPTLLRFLGFPNAAKA